MRVIDEERVAAQRREQGRRGDFSAALRQAEGRRAEAGRADRGRAETGRAAQRVEDLGAARRGAEARGGPGAVGGTGPARGAGGLRDLPVPGPDRLAASGGPVSPDAGTTPGVALGAGPGGAGGADAAGLPERAVLSRAVRALPPVIETFQASGQVALSLDFGGALGVELRRAPEGVEVTLSVLAALRPAARAELAGLCRTLVARGVAVASAEVRGGRPGRGRW